MNTPVILDARVVTGSGGGPEKTILNSPRFLEPLGYKMMCAYLHPPADPGFESIRQKAVHYHAPLIEIADRGPWDWRVITKLLSVCRENKVAIWHGHDYKTNALGLLLKRFWPMKLVTTVHGWVQKSRRTPLYYKIDRICLTRYERVICVSDDLLDECTAIGVRHRRLILLENAIDTTEYTRQLSVADAKQRLGLPTRGFVIGAVGRLAAEKAFDILLRSVHELVRRGLDVHLVIVGEGPERATLQQLIQTLGLGARVFLPGWQDNVKQYYEAMDVFALSSLREGLPNVVLEAMALEVPVVATRVNGVPRLIQDGRTGLLVEPGNQDAMSTALFALIHNERLRDVFRQGGRNTIVGRFSFAVRMEKMKQLYDELLAS